MKETGNNLKETRDYYLQLTQQAHQVTNLDARNIQRQTQNLLNTLEWKS